MIIIQQFKRSMNEQVRKYVLKIQAVQGNENHGLDEIKSPRKLCAADTTMHTTDTGITLSTLEKNTAK